MKVTLMAAHMADSARKVNFHFWVEAMNALGIDVDFVTVGFSDATKFKKSSRQFNPPYNQWVHLNPHLRKYLWKPLFHPFSLGHPVLNKMTSKILSYYPSLMPHNLKETFADTDLFIIENGAGLLLTTQLKKQYPNAKFLYSVCDRIETLGYHPLVLQAEKDSLPLFDVIRVPSIAMQGDYDAKYNVQFIPHGLDKTIFDKDNATPYTRNNNVISVGDMLFDADTVLLLATTFPKWTFHLFGKKAKLDNPPSNVIAYGERPFDFIVPFIQHADIGLAPYRNAVNADYLSQSSLKMNQYSYCKLPILAPNFAAAGRNHVCGYEPEDKQSRISAMEKATMFDRDTINTAEIIDAMQSTTLMLNSVGIKT